MPIKGLTEQARFPTIGQLRKGAPKPSNGRAPGKDLDYFRFTSPDDGLEDAFRDAYGAEPRSLEVYLPYPSADENFEAYLEEYAASGLLRRCDGERLIMKREGGGEISAVERPCERGLPCQCKPAGRLTVILPKLEHFAVVMVLTTSKHDIMNLYGALKRYELVARHSGGDLTGIPFTLKRVPRRISTPGKDGKRARREKWLLAIEPSPAWVSVQLQAARQRALSDGTVTPAGTPMLTDGHPDTGSGEACRRGAGQPRRSDIGVGGTAQTVPGYATVADIRSALTGADKTVVRELQTASTDFGFTGRERDLRLAFGALVAGRSLESFSAATGEEAAAIQRVLEWVSGRLPDRQARLAFAAYCVRCGLSLAEGDDVAGAVAAFAQWSADTEDWNEDHPFADDHVHHHPTVPHHGTHPLAQSP